MKNVEGSRRSNRETKRGKENDQALLGLCCFLSFPSFFLSFILFFFFFFFFFYFYFVFKKKKKKFFFLLAWPFFLFFFFFFFFFVMSLIWAVIITHQSFTPGWPGPSWAWPGEEDNEWREERNGTRIAREPPISEQNRNGSKTETAAGKTTIKHQGQYKLQRECTYHGALTEAMAEAAVHAAQVLHAAGASGLAADGLLAPAICAR